MFYVLLSSNVRQDDSISLFGNRIRDESGTHKVCRMARIDWVLGMVAGVSVCILRIVFQHSRWLSLLYFLMIGIFAIQGEEAP